jgi:hypothetical protein
MSLLSCPRAHSLRPWGYPVTATVRRDAIKGTLRRLSLLMHESKTKILRSEWRSDYCRKKYLLTFYVSTVTVGRPRAVLNTRHIYYSVSLQHAMNKLGHPEDGSSTYLRNIGILNHFIVKKPKQKPICECLFCLLSRNSLNYR